MTLNSEKSMLATSLMWGGAVTFQLITLNNECPFLEVFYHPEARELVILTKMQKENFHMVHQVDANGFAMKMKNNLRHQDGTEYKKERRHLSVSHDYRIKERKDIEGFVDLFIYNSEFDYKKVIEDIDAKYAEFEKQAKLVEEAKLAELSKIQEKETTTHLAKVD